MRILVVEDEQDIRNYLKKSLEDDCFVVDAAENGQAGLVLATANTYDLLLLDNIMPVMGGRELCERLRAQGIETPILMLSVKTEATTKADLLNAGADDYLTKPFSVNELLARVRALLRRPKRIETEVYQIDDLVMDDSRHIVTRGGQELYLARKEYMLLKYLMKNQGTVLSRSMLMEHVWDMSADLFSNTIESHIVSLRKKIDLPGKKRLIQTVNGRGYKVDLPV